MKKGLLEFISNILFDIIIVVTIIIIITSVVISIYNLHKVKQDKVIKVGVRHAETEEERMKTGNDTIKSEK